MKAQLARSTNLPQHYILSDIWGMQQKVDGHRMLINCGDTVQAFNRQGDPRECPEEITSFFSALRGWTFDGELLDDKYYIFDILEIPTGNCQNWPLLKRYELLEKLESKLKNPVYLLPLFIENKQEQFDKLLEDKAEGVIFKLLDAPYVNKKSSNFLKYKFINEVDCVILEAGFNDKENFVLGLWDGSGFVDVGKCSSLTADGPSAKVGDVVTVQVLYSTKGGRLYQAVAPRLRHDKAPQECLVGQIEECRTNKQILCH